MADVGDTALETEIENETRLAGLTSNTFEDHQIRKADDYIRTAQQRLTALRIFRKVAPPE